MPALASSNIFYVDNKMQSSISSTFEFVDHYFRLQDGGNIGIARRGDYGATWRRRVCNYIKRERS